jgi:hypothetical protein
METVEGQSGANQIVGRDIGHEQPSGGGGVNYLRLDPDRCQIGANPFKPKELFRSHICVLRTRQVSPDAYQFE